jgi:hypothetical protein
MFRDVKKDFYKDEEIKNDPVHEKIFPNDAIHPHKAAGSTWYLNILLRLCHQVT